MQQTDIKTGERYLFAYTTVAHRQNMVGQVVKVVGRSGGNTKRGSNQSGAGKGRKPTRFKLENGQYANAAELKPLPA